nr:YopX family protein [uncultured Prevotella sp.]
MTKREILFRGWNEKNKKWLYGYYFAYRGYHFISPDVLKDLSTPLDEYLVDADSVGQYTGLKDANGVKIFEGDVIENNGSRHVMQYNERKAMFVTALVGVSYIKCGIDQRWIDEFGKVVVGNVYEDKELIKTT